mgnify:FL=1
MLTTRDHEQDLDEDGDQVLTKEELLNALNDPEVTKKREQELFAQFQVGSIHEHTTV